MHGHHLREVEAIKIKFHCEQYGSHLLAIQYGLAGAIMVDDGLQRELEDEPQHDQKYI